jgi:signal peptidase I
VNRRTAVRSAWTIASALLVLLFLKTFVCDVKHVDSGSMEPFIFGAEGAGESVLVRYDSSPPKRFETVVILRRGETTPIVKRVVGLGGESVQISNGDLLIDNHRLPPDAPRPAPIIVFDDRWQRVDEAFGMGGSKLNPWKPDGDAWILDAAEIAHGEQTGLMYLLANVHDDYLAPDHSLVRGKDAVNDLVLECEARADEPHGELRFMLTEQGDTFEISIRPSEHGTAELVLTRRFDVEEMLAQGAAPFAVRAVGSVGAAGAPDAWHRVRFSNIDNVLRVELDGADVFAPVVYKENHPHPRDLAQEGKSFPHRVYIGGEEGRFAFRRIRVLRDLYYTQRGHYGVEAPAELGPDECFVLGDNSAESRDSREWGPVHDAEILGRPTWVVWPPGRIRRLASVGSR